MIAYILIIYMSGYNAGGPAMVQFQDKEACESAREAVKSTFGRRLEASICVPSASQR